VACSYQGVLVDEPEKQRIREQVEKINNLAALGELAAGVAHEINNPNATILLNIALLKDMGEGSLRLLDEYFQTRGDFTVGRLPYTRVRDEIPRLHAEIRDAAERIRRIVEDMKDFTRISPDQSRQLLSINEIAEAAIRLTHNIVKNSTSHFQVDFASDLPLVNVNRQQLEQVIVNLLINASQSLTSRSEAITLQTFHGAKGAVGLVVADQGCGISPEHLPHVTDPFFTTRRERGGTGLGLSISARIIHDHHGQLIIESLGRGTTVKITIPAATGRI
jgi:polar amino acid transport system substrate-binding protein